MPIWEGYPDKISADAVTEACTYFLGRDCVDGMACGQIVLPEIAKIAALHAFVSQYQDSGLSVKGEFSVKVIYDQLRFAAILREAIRLQWKGIYYDGTVSEALDKLFQPA